MGFRVYTFFTATNPTFMKRLLILTVDVMALFACRAMAQQALWGGSEIISPEIHDEHSVTFRVSAPGAGEVRLSGDWMPSEGWVDRFHSLHISRYYPDTFDYIGLFSPAILPDQDVSSSVYEDIDGTLKKQMENGYRLYWIGIGKKDFLYSGMVEFSKKLESMGMNHTFRESDGGHIWKNGGTTFPNSYRSCSVKASKTPLPIPYLERISLLIKER